MCVTKKKEEVTSSARDVWDKSQIRSKPEFPLRSQPLTPRSWDSPGADFFRILDTSVRVHPSLRTLSIR